MLKLSSEDVVKFGIAGLSGGSSSWGRLHQYINTYGYSSDMSACSGIQMLYLAGNVYNKDVEVVKSEIYKKELACKRNFR